MIGNTAGELAGFLQVREPQPPADEATKGIISFTSKHQRMSLGLNLKPSRFVCKKSGHATQGTESANFSERTAWIHGARKVLVPRIGVSVEMLLLGQLPVTCRPRPIDH
jgi:hypothetical protein